LKFAAVAKHGADAEGCLFFADMHRVYFDTNEQTRRGYALWLPTSRDDLVRIGPELREGLRVIIEMTGELEMEAILEFDAEASTWVAVGLHDTLKHHPDAVVAYDAMMKDRNAQGS
jgi:hypothetical protein